MGKRYSLIIGFTGVMWITALVGYSIFGDDAQSTPSRIRFDNAGGIVVFDHIKHAEKYGIACQTCHHESATARDNVQNCGTCHGVEFNDAFITNHTTAITDDASCVTCHHSAYQASTWDHAAHVEDYGLDCTSCHHDEDIEPEPTNCADCHESGQDAGDESMPNIKNAVHARCADCHQDMFDEGVQGCGNCHDFTDKRALFASSGDATVDANSADCMQCHEGQKIKDLIPNRMSAFHGQCMSCHEDAGKGPFAKDQCKQCHTK